jgi:hypothetical protein
VGQQHHTRAFHTSWARPADMVMSNRRSS